MAQIKTDRNQSNAISYYALVPYAPVFGFIRISRSESEARWPNFPFLFVERTRYPTRVNQAILQSPRHFAQIDNRLQRNSITISTIYIYIYSGISSFFFVLSLFPSLSFFLSRVRMKRLNAKCSNYRDLGTKKFDGEECCKTSRRRLEQSSWEWSTRLLHLRRGLREIVAKWWTHPCTNWTLNVFWINELRLWKIDLPCQINRTKKRHWIHVGWSRGRLKEKYIFTLSRLPRNS